MLNVSCLAIFVSLLLKVWYDTHVVVGERELVRHGIFGRGGFVGRKCAEYIEQGPHVEGELTKIALAPPNQMLSWA